MHANTRMWIAIADRAAEGDKLISCMPAESACHSKKRCRHPCGIEFCESKQFSLARPTKLCDRVQVYSKTLQLW